MAFPTVETRASGTDAADAVTRNIAQPAGSGSLVIVCISKDGGGGLATTSTGWVELADVAQGTAVSGAVYYNNTTADALTVTSASEWCGWVALRVLGSSGNPSASSSVAGTTNSDPASHSPAGGALDYLWLAFRAGDATVRPTAAPANYSNLTHGGTTTDANATQASTAERLLNASSENPGVFTSALAQWVCFTIAVAGVADGLIVPRRPGPNFRR